MEHRRKRWGFALTEIFMSLLIVISAVILVLDWKHYEYFFIIAFAAAALLFLARGIRTIGEDKSHLAGAFPSSIMSTSAESAQDMPNSKPSRSGISR